MGGRMEEDADDEWGSLECRIQALIMRNIVSKNEGNQGNRHGYNSQVKNPSKISTFDDG
jgi:hypothetical protein